MKTFDLLIERQELGPITTKKNFRIIHELKRHFFFLKKKTEEIEVCAEAAQQGSSRPSILFSRDSLSRSIPAPPLPPPSGLGFRHPGCAAAAQINQPRRQTAAASSSLGSAASDRPRDPRDAAQLPAGPEAAQVGAFPAARTSAACPSAFPRARTRTRRCLRTTVF